MPITAPHIKISFRYTFLGQKCQNVQWYAPVGAAFLTADMTGVLTAVWDNVKTAFRALGSTSLSVSSWDSLLGEELGGGGSFAEFPVPPAEQVGTRAGLTATSAMPSFVAVGCRQVVGTRVTRPGQKRLPFVADSDVEDNLLVAGSQAIWQAAFDKFCTPMILGAPVATGVLNPEVGGTLVAHVPTVWQDVLGSLLDQDITSQVSRKKGRGI